MPRLTAADIARQVEGELLGDPDVPITGVASLDEASVESLSFLGNDKYASRVLPSAAGCVIVPLDFSQAPPAGRAWIKVEKPSAAFSALVATFIEAMPPPEPGVHPAAVVATGVVVPADAHVGACAVIEAGVTIGAGSIIEAGCYVGRDARIGSHCRLWPNTTVREACVLGDRVIIHSGTVIGSDGFGYEPGATGHTKIPQLGIVQIDDDVEIGANCAIDRARFGRTWIKAGAKIDNLVQVAHNVVIGELCFVVAQVGIAGSCTIGRGVMIGGQAGLAGHLHVGDGAKILAKAGIMNDVEPGEALIGAPALPRREFFRQMMFKARLPDMYQDIKDLKAEVAALRQQLADAAADDQP